MNYNETISIATRPRGSEAVMSRHLGPWWTTFYRPRIVQESVRLSGQSPPRRPSSSTRRTESASGWAKASWDA